MIPGRNLRPGIFYSGAANLRQISDCVVGWSPDQPTDATEGLLFSAGWFSNLIVRLLDHVRKARRRPDGRVSGLVRRPAHNEGFQFPGPQGPGWTNCWTVGPENKRSRLRDRSVTPRRVRSRIYLRGDRSSTARITFNSDWSPAASCPSSQTITPARWL